jgi:hypothetical protein
MVKLEELSSKKYYKKDILVYLGECYEKIEFRNLFTFLSNPSVPITINRNMTLTNNRILIFNFISPCCANLNIIINSFSYRFGHAIKQLTKLYLKNLLSFPFFPKSEIILSKKVIQQQLTFFLLIDKDFFTGLILKIENVKEELTFVTFLNLVSALIENLSNLISGLKFYYPLRVFEKLLFELFILLKTMIFKYYY